MKHLSAATLNSLPSTVIIPNYSLTDVRASILHFGVGNFHRAHQAVYADNLLRQGKTDSGIIGVSLRSPGMRDELIEQDYLYSVATLDKTTIYRVIGALKDILVAPEDPQRVIAQVAAENITVVTTTITEKAYYLKDGHVDLTSGALAFDLENSTAPKTIYGFIAAGILARYNTSATPITILCCDNIQDGGEQLQAGVSYLLKEYSPIAYKWMQQNVSFISSMVDRITPATTPEIITDTMQALNVKDASPVPAETYTQWVIEDNFISPAPDFAKAGALLVASITEYETVKLRFLNAAHSILATIGYLCGDEYIHETMQRKTVKDLTETLLRDELTGITAAPKGIELQAYITETLARFAQPKIPYRVLQVGSDTSLKIQQRWFPAIELLLNNKQKSSRFAFILAAWVVFIERTIENDTMNDPAKSSFLALQCSASQTHVMDILALANAKHFSFYSDTEFMVEIVTFYEAIHKSPILNLIDALNGKDS
jgi:fructuronate reductase